jgi:DNA polymerase III epsilon subunit-like protein
MYAIVDIETTGSHPQDNGITEIAIVLHDGEQVEERFSTLVNPGLPDTAVCGAINRYYQRHDCNRTAVCRSGP